MDAIGPLLKPGEVAALFRVDSKTVLDWAKGKKIRRIATPGGHGRYRESDVRALLNEQGVTDAEADALIAAVRRPERPAPVAHGHVPAVRDLRAPQ